MTRRHEQSGMIVLPNRGSTKKGLQDTRWIMGVNARANKCLHHEPPQNKSNLHIAQKPGPCLQCCRNAGDELTMLWRYFSLWLCLHMFPFFRRTRTRTRTRFISRDTQACLVWPTATWLRLLNSQDTLGADDPQRLCACTKKPGNQMIEPTSRVCGLVL